LILRWKRCHLETQAGIPVFDRNGLQWPVRCRACPDGLLAYQVALIPPGDGCPPPDPGTPPPQPKAAPPDRSPPHRRARRAGFAGAAARLTLDELNTVVQVNLVAVLDLCRLMAPLLFASDRGSMINIASIYGLVASRGPMAAYNSTKAALVDARIGGAIAAGFVPADYAVMLRWLTGTIISGSGSRPNDDIEKVTGRPPITFQDFARRNAPAWTFHAAR